MESAQSTKSTYRMKSSFWALPFGSKLNPRQARRETVPVMKYKDDYTW